MASTAKTLTFVIPAYNMESYLDRCVNSLLSASDISDLEVLIVDDGSKDGTLEYARKLERTNPSKWWMRMIGSTRRPSTRFWPRCVHSMTPTNRLTCW